MTIGIVCEYNPFHNGHIYQIQKIKEKYPDATLIICLNGLFTERGRMSVLSVEDKTRIALLYGADLVVLLPTFYGTQSGDFFAEGALQILNALKIDKLIFGSETTNISYLENIAKKQLKNDFKLQKNGTSYPARLNEALNEKKVISSNDLLGISYIKAILKNNYPISYECMKRTVGYFDETPNGTFASASYIREHWGLQIQKYIPKEIYSLYHSVSMDSLFPYLKYKILTDSHLQEYLDVTEGLDYKCKKEILYANSYEDFVKRLKSKRYTYSRIERMLLHIFLGIQKKDANIKLSYITFLGMNAKGKEYIKKKKKDFLLPSSLDVSSPIYLYEKNATLLYDQLNHTDTKTFFFRNKPYISNSDKESNQK